MIKILSELLLVMLTAGVVGCGDSGSATGPAGPSPAGAVTTPVNHGELIGGTVSDSALRPLSGARVELLDGPEAGTSATTDANGWFSLIGTVDDATRFRASKAGHVTADATILPFCDGCNPKRWVHFYLNVLEPPVAIAGDYTLSFAAGSTCSNLPNELRARSYDVTIAPGDFPWWGFPPQASTSFKVTPKGLAFPDSLNFFWLNVAGNVVTVVLGDHTDPGVTERVDQNTYFAFGGSATVSVEPPVAAISTTFHGWIDYCVNPSMGPRYDCSAGPAVTHTRCDSPNHQLVLTRR